MAWELSTSKRVGVCNCPSDGTALSEVQANSVYAAFDNLFVVVDRCCKHWKGPSNGCYSPIWGGALACLVLWPVLAAAPREQDPESAPAKRRVVDAPSGKVEGQQDGKMLVFKGIPYALPPVGRHVGNRRLRCLDGRSFERRRNSVRRAISRRSRSRRSTRAVRCR